MVRCLDAVPGSPVRAFGEGRWFEYVDGRWQENRALRAPNDDAFVFADPVGKPVKVAVAWREVRQILRFGATNYLATRAEPLAIISGKTSALGWPTRYQVNQMAISADGRLLVASDAGLFRQRDRGGWENISIVDNGGRSWASRDVLGVTPDSQGQLWFATKAGVGHSVKDGWRFYEGKDGLPWNEFTGIAAGPGGEVWFGTTLGAIRFDGQEWQYRQGPLWLPNDHVTQIAVDKDGAAWLSTAGGIASIQRQPTTLAEKAEVYETEIERYIKRTPLGYVAEAPLRTAGDKSSAAPLDSDNDGLWTAMYGAGQCFAYGATGSPKAKARARQAFEALRFLQAVTQGGSHAPPPGYIARTVRSTKDPDPNIGRLEQDRRATQRDKLWKIYEPRWPKSADGKWYWKSDTSSDELDGHYFFYPLYYDLCADTDAEKERVREVVRGITDHLLAHDLVLVDHDGRPTRWGIYGPQYLNWDPFWWPERGLNSLSILSYLSAAAHVTGDEKYTARVRDLMDHHGYAHNAMYPKVQHGPGSGNQSDDEMAFMCYYTLLRCSNEPALKDMIRASFHHYWVNEAPEMNPFFNFAYAAHGLGATSTSPWGTFSTAPWAGWLEDSMTTLYGFPLDRLNWPHRNSHRLDIAHLSRSRASDLDSPDPHPRGARVGGKVLPVENRHFNHWNTDPWELDYGGSGDELAAGTVFLLPYYMGLYHKFIDLPKP